MKWQLGLTAIFLTGALLAQEPELKCEKKRGEITWEGMTFKRYGIRADHFPAQKKFHLYLRNCEGLENKIASYVANEKGHLIFQSNEELQKGTYAVCPVRLGEEITFVMRAEDGEEHFSSEVLPFPHQMKSKKGAVLNLNVRSAGGNDFLLRVFRLRPGETVSIICKFEQNEVGIPANVDEKGKLEAVISLPHSGEGRAALIVKRESEEVLFPFEWGKTSLKYAGACCLEVK